MYAHASYTLRQYAGQVCSLLGARLTRDEITNTVQPSYLAGLPAWDCAESIVLERTECMSELEFQRG